MPSSSSAGALPEHQAAPATGNTSGNGVGEAGAEQVMSAEAAQLVADGKKRVRAVKGKLKELDDLKDELKDKKTVQLGCNYCRFGWWKTQRTLESGSHPKP